MTLRFRARENHSSAPGDIIITADDESFSVPQAGAPCRIRLVPPHLTFDFVGGTGKFRVVAPDGCSWTWQPDGVLPG